MPEKQFTILSTRPIDQAVIDHAAANNILIESISFIETTSLKNDDLLRRIAAIGNEPAVVIFTSMNAAEAVAEDLGEATPGWKIYCLGTATRKIIEQHFTGSTIAGTGANASELADEIITNQEKRLFFFCGDQRREELPVKLSEHNINVEEIVVYNTLAIAEKIDRHYDGILFFSPSAVESFFSSNTIAGDTVLFAIGTTTSASIREHSNNQVIESDYPGKQHLVEKSITYFSTLNYTNEHFKK